MIDDGLSTMSGDACQPDDLVFLISRGLDGDLSPAERRRLDEALSRSEQLRSEAAGLQAVGHIVARWGRRSVEVDWERQAALVAAMARSSNDERLGKVDELLQRWRNRNAEVESIDLTASVVARIRSERRLAKPYRLGLRLGVPLAAAAVVALALTATTWLAPPRKPISRVVIGPSSWRSTVDETETESRAEVRFARSTKHAGTMQTRPGIGFAAMGVEPAGPAGEENTPL